MQTVLILQGLQGSGKSTFAHLLTSYSSKWTRINYDEIRHNSPHFVPPYKFSKKNEQRVKEIGDIQAVNALEAGQSLVIDNMNLTNEAVDHWGTLARAHKAFVEIKPFFTPLNVCLQRNENRTGWAKLPRPVIERAALRHNLVPWPRDRKAVIVDMDGTLADSSVRVEKFLPKKCRNCEGMTVRPNCRCSFCAKTCPVCKGTGKPKKDWDGFYSEVINDKPRKEIAQWVDSLKDVFHIIVVSGRPIDRAGQATCDWLAKHNIHYDRIFMRNSGDFRPDTVVKKEILDHINIPIAFAIDDRPSVVRMWGENGVKVYDVGDGEEF